MINSFYILDRVEVDYNNGNFYAMVTKISDAGEYNISTSSNLRVDNIFNLPKDAILLDGEKGFTPDTTRTYLENKQSALDELSPIKL